MASSSQAVPPARQYGITDPLSTVLPTDAENKLTDDLIAELKSQNNYESAEETQMRHTVLESLQSITEEFVKVVSKAQGKSEIVIKSSGGKIFTYGSFRLGVYGPGSDIDTLVVAPKHVSRDEFFKYYPDVLLRMAPPGAVTELTPVTEAFVPIIKFEFSGISIDLIFCNLELNSIPKDQSLKSSDVLRGLDDRALRSVNGIRVTDEIIELVPQPAVFRVALRAIKLWAQRRAIYANIMGFPGGVAWAMLVARVCQLYPMAAASTIVQSFFRILEKWPWPQPVMLKKIEPGPLKVRVWNPKIYHQDQYHLMPIITPAYPSMCATHNVTLSTLEVVKNELKNGGIITDRIKRGKATWKELFVKHSFFTKDYKFYLSVISASTTKEAQLFWSGFVESKVRVLAQQIEQADFIALSHPFNKAFERTHKCKNDDEVEKVKGGCLDFQIKEGLDDSTDSKNGSTDEAKTVTDSKENGVTNGKAKEPADGAKSTTVYTTTHYIGLALHEGFKGRLDLAKKVEDFKKLCTNWDKYNAELNALTIVFTRNYDLPNDVFTEGEVKPARPQKKKPSNKRSSTGNDDGHQAKKQHV